jgi:cytochrome c biogenesis protein CcmG/thiol:disulfide interchange protein DsbE
MGTMHEKHGNRGVPVIAVNVDASRTDADRFLKAVPAAFQVSYDPDGQPAQQFELGGMPNSCIAGAGGRVAVPHEGFR